MYSLRMSFWTVPRSAVPGTPCSSATSSEGRGRRAAGGGMGGAGRVEGHRRRDGAERDPVEEEPHVLDRVDRDTGAADLPERMRIVRVVAELRRQVEGHREPGLAAFEQIAEALV